MSNFLHGHEPRARDLERELALLDPQLRGELGVAVARLDDEALGVGRGRLRALPATIMDTI